MAEYKTKEILKEYERSREQAQKDYKERIDYINKSIPEIKEIDNKIRTLGLEMTKLVLDDTKDSNYIDLEIDRIKAEIEALKQQKAFILTENNFPLSFLKIHYQCDKCSDTGFLTTGKKCTCFKQKIIDSAYGISNLKDILRKENFSKFDINIFSDKEYEGEESSPKENMQKILATCEDFVENFNEDNGDNLLLFGPTGLGKTFLCNSIAKALLDKGYLVVYQTAFKIIDILANYKFHDRTSNSEEAYNLLFQSDLLIIDDLGTELNNTFANIEIFNILNNRLINGKKTIISTNLTPLQLKDIYSDRVTSRLFGNYKQQKFFGPDLRWERQRG
jgi:DNA replication protein DnaC